MRLRSFLTLMVLALVASGLSAQDATPEPTGTPVPGLGDAPSIVVAALNDLNQQTGGNFDLSNINWTWQEEAFNDGSLGCPQEGQLYTQAVTRGYIIRFTAGGTTYDYRASSDGNNLFLCETSETAQIDTEATAEATAETTPSGTTGGITLENASSVVQVAQLNTEEGVTALADWSADGSVIIAASSREAGGVLVFSAEDTAAPPTRFETEAPVTSFDTVEVDGVTYLATGGANGRIAYFPIVPEGLDVIVMNTEDSAATVNSLVISPDGNLIAAGAGDFEEGDSSTFSLTLWSTRTGEMLQSLPTETAVTAVAFATASRADNPEQSAILLAVGGADGSVRLFELTTQADADSVAVSAEALATLTAHDGAVRDLSFNTEGTLLASSGTDSAIHLWNTDRDQTALGEAFLTLFPETNNAGLAVAFHPDGNILATAGGDPEAEIVDNTIRLWDISDPANVRVLVSLGGHTGTVGSLAFSPDGDVLISASDDGSIRLWGVAQ